MSNKETKPSFFQKMLEAGTAVLDQQIQKSKTHIMNTPPEEDFLFSKTVTEDPSYSLHSQGWTDKPYRLQNPHLKQMSYQDTTVAGVIQTRQNQVAGYASLVTSETTKGWMIILEDEDALLEKIKEELIAQKSIDGAMSDEQKPDDGEVPNAEDFKLQDEVNKALKKAEEDLTEASTDTSDLVDEGSDDQKSDDEVEEFDFELERKAKEKLKKKFEKQRKRVENFIKNCGLEDKRPFREARWNFEGALRAWTRDTYTYDLYATEITPDKANRPHHWFPVDGGTIKFASRDLRRYRDVSQNFFNIDILYPERTKDSDAISQAIELNQELLDKDMYKWVQVIRGKVERAYTADELKVGIRNVNTDIYNNGYGISELELLISMVTGHLNAEYYNQAYFTQGFSAKGILHIKSNINRRKLETVRMQWQHMLKGVKNSFQTPIFAGVDDVNWIPLTQNHNDIGFEGWMRYLITMIGVIYQIDPSEMGIHLKAEGSGGGSLGNKEDLKDKTNNSKDRGLYPLLKHYETYINENIVKPFDPRFKLKFVGLDGATPHSTLERQEKEVKFAKTVNEIRGEMGLHPLPGMDDIILNPDYMKWYDSYSEKGMKKAKDAQDQAMKTSQMGLDHEKEMAASQGDIQPQNEVDPSQDVYGEGALNTFGESPVVEKGLKKSTIIEVYTHKD